MSEGLNKMKVLEKKIEGDSETIEKLKKEILDGKKVADAAHTREQRAQEVIENLRVSIVKLTDEIEQKNKQLALEQQ